MSQAANDRNQAAKAIGLAPVGAGVRPLQRFADGRLGYALNGRGEESSRALRRGIHQIFPTLSELQLDAYVRAVTERGVNLLDHYRSLQGQLDQLQQTLTAWQNAASNAISSIRRRRVANALRRCWRRKLVDAHDQYELMIDGEHTSSLPVLPEGLDYAHVRRLVLRNMSLQAVDEAFLRCFPNVVELDLSNNRLTRVPAGVDTLTQLRRLDLSHNQIVLDAEANRQLSRLELLNTFEISFNPIMEAPDLSGLRHVRHVCLRATELDDVRQVLERTTLRALNDLRDNRIVQISHDLDSLNRERLDLHDNPIPESSRQYLDRIRGANAQDGQRGATYEHRQADAQVRASWVESSDPAVRAQRRATWDRLMQEPGSADLSRFLADFLESDDFDGHPGHYRRRVWRILNACEHNEVLRELVFRTVGGTRSCDDRLLLLLSRIEVGVLVQQGITGAPAARIEQRLLQLGRQLYRLGLVDGIASRHIAELREMPRVRLDEIETRLYYQVHLAERLDLPVHLEDMHFASFANVSRRDLQLAEAEVTHVETTEAILDSLAHQPFWQRFVRDRHAERFEALVAPFYQRLDGFEEQARASGEHAYIEGAAALMREIADAEQQLVRLLAKEAWDRNRP